MRRGFWRISAMASNICDLVTELWLAARDGEVVPLQVRDHISRCGACQHKVGRLQWAWRGLARLRQVQAPSTLWEQVRGNLHRAKPAAPGR